MKLGKRLNKNELTIHGFACSCGCGSSTCSTSGCSCTNAYDQYANGRIHSSERYDAYVSRRDDISWVAVAN